MADLETNRKIITEIIDFDSLIITKLGAAIREYKSAYAWFEKFDKKNKLYVLGAELPSIKNISSRINDLYSDVIESLQRLINNLKKYDELKETVKIYSDISEDVQKAQEETKKWMDEELKCLVDFEKDMRKNGKPNKEIISKFKTNKVKELYINSGYGHIRDDGKAGYDARYQEIKDSLKKAWGSDGYQLALGEKTEYGIKLKKFKKMCNDIIKISDEYIKWSKKSIKEKPSKDNIGKVEQNLTPAADKIQKGVSYIIEYTESELLPGINLKNNDIPALEELKKIKIEIPNWHVDVIEYLNGSLNKVPDIKKIEPLVDRIKNLVEKISLKAFGEKIYR